jgi:hypothetical protein
VAHGEAAPTGGDGGSGETEEEEKPGGPVLGRKAEGSRLVSVGVKERRKWGER